MKMIITMTLRIKMHQILVQKKRYKDNNPDVYRSQNKLDTSKTERATFITHFSIYKQLTSILSLR